MRVTFWGSLADLAGPEREAAGDTPDAVRTVLTEADPTLGDALGAKGVQVVADDAFVEWDTPLDGVRELAFMPPMSGG